MASSTILKAETAAVRMVDGERQEEHSSDDRTTTVLRGHSSDERTTTGLRGHSSDDRTTTVLRGTQQ